jgi:hypothetical protein
LEVSVATIADLLVHIGIDASDLESGMESIADGINENFAMITAAGAAGGLAMEGFARKMAGPNEAIRRLAARTGLGEDAMRDLAKETSNVTFPLDQVLSLMETGMQRGLEGADALQQFASFWDMVGDATGESATALGEASAALQAVGIDAANQHEALSAIGFITDNTTSSVGEFLAFLDRTGPQLREMGANVDDAAAILGALESELGMTGRTARTEFRKAVNAADGDLGAMLETLGLSEDQFKKYQGAVSDASGVIERNADIHADSFTPLQKLSHAAEETMLQYGGLASMAGSLAMPMMALGPISKGVSLGLSGIAKIGPAVTGAFSMVGKAFMVLSKLLMANPWILLIAATIALVVLIVKNWDKILEFLKKAWEWIKTAAGAVWDAVKDAFQAGVDFIKNLFLNFTPLGLIIKNFDAIKDAATGVWNWLKEKFQAAVDFVKNLFMNFTPLGFIISRFDDIKALATGLKDWISDRIDDVVSFFREMPGRIGRVVVGLFDGIKDAFRSAINWVIDKWNSLSFSIPSIDTPFGKLGGGSIGVPKIPRLHDGGVFNAPAGKREGLALLEDGEHVVSSSDSTLLTDLVAELKRLSTQKGDVTINMEQVSPHVDAQRVGAVASVMRRMETV